MIGDRWGRKILLWLAIGLLATTAFGLATDMGKTSQVIEQFDWEYLPAALALTLLNYALRFVKWQYYLGVIGVRGLSVSHSAFIFFSSFAMTLTPGKLGEWLKSYLLRQMTGTPIGISAPIIVAERLSDGIAMVILASIGLLTYTFAWQIVAIALLPATGVILIIHHPRLADSFLCLAARLPIVSKRVHHLRDFYTSAQRLLSARRLLLAVAIGVLSWSGESVAFYLILLGLGMPPSLLLLVQATFVLALSTLIGAVALTPGGIAVAEGSIAGLLLVLGIITQPSIAGAATLLIRFCTLWFGVGIGIVTLLVASRLVTQSRYADSGTTN